VLTGAQDNEETIERVAALDIGKAELVCCVRVPDEDRPGRRLQEVETYSTMTRPLLGMADRLACWRPPGWRPGWSTQEAQQTLAGLQVQQHEVSEQQQTITAILASIRDQLQKQQHEP
jgi:hypothetical protein